MLFLSLFWSIFGYFEAMSEAVFMILWAMLGYFDAILMLFWAMLVYFEAMF